MRRLAALLAPLALVAGLATFATSHQNAQERPESVSAARVVPTTGVSAQGVLAVDFEEAYAVQVEVDAYLAAEHERQLAGFYAGVQAEAQRQADELAARRSAAPPTIRVGNCCGPHSDAWWWGVAICEQGGRNDPYFGYFSFMDGSAGGKTWEEQVAMGNALLARVGREVPTWAQSCVDAGYRASPSG
jgi:hypothetical protein